MERFERFTSVAWQFVGLGGGVLTYLSAAPKYIGLDTALIILTTAVAGIVGALVYSLHDDIENQFEEMQTEMREGLDKTIEKVEDLDDGDVRTDGGVNGSGNDEDDEEFNALLPENDSDEGPSGSGALGGMIAGGALGSPFGPAGVIVGGILGGLLGNEAEYQNLREKRQERIKDAAWEYVYREYGIRRKDGEIAEITDHEDEEGRNFIRFLFVLNSGDEFAIRLYRDTERFVTE